MNLLIAGATRGIGSRLLDQALTAGHCVTALARNPEKLSERLGKTHERLKVLKADLLDRASLAGALVGQDAVCCTVGVKTPWEQRALFSEGTRNLLQEMATAGVRRLICVTGVGAGDSRGHGGFLYDCVFFPLLLKSVYADKDQQEQLIRASDTDWTIVRPGFLTNGPLTGTYRVLTDMRGVTARTIARADVAHFILGELATPHHIGQTPLLSY